MNILVCISNVPDTTTKVKFVESNTQFDSAGVQWVINPWDELALTRALELKEDAGNAVSNITVVNVGQKNTEPTIRKALAIGTDSAVRIDAEPKDAFAVASLLAEYVKTNSYDIILSGIESSDYNGSLVGGMLAEMLDVSSVSAVSKMEIQEDNIILNREIDGGKETVSVNTPLVAIVQKGIAKEPRIAAMRGIMMAKKKPLQVIENSAVESITEYVSYDLPEPKPACKMIDADNVKELVTLLKEEAKVI